MDPQNPIDVLQVLRNATKDRDEKERLRREEEDRKYRERIQAFTPIKQSLMDLLENPPELGEWATKYDHRGGDWVTKWDPLKFEGEISDTSFRLWVSSFGSGDRGNKLHLEIHGQPGDTPVLNLKADGAGIPEKIDKSQVMRDDYPLVANFIAQYLVKYIKGSLGPPPKQKG